MHLFFQNKNLELFVINLWPIWIIVFMFTFAASLEVIIFGIFFIILIHLKSYFLCIISSFVPYANVSVESIILLSSAAFNTILISASVNTCLLVLNVCCDFKISLLFFMNSFWFSKRLSTSTLFFSNCFILFSSWVASKQRL